MFALIATPLLAALLQASPAPAPAGPPTPPPLTSPSPTASPAAEPTPAPAETPSPAPSTSPSPSPAPTPATPYAYVVNPTPQPSGEPQITQIALNDKVQHENGDLLIRVTTSADVSQVMLRAMGRQIALPQTAPGLFGAEQRLPGGIPFFFLNRWYNVDFVASTADGRSTTVTVPVRLEH